MEKNITVLYKYESKKYITNLYKNYCSVRPYKKDSLLSITYPLYEIIGQDATEDSYKINFGNPLAFVNMVKCTVVVEKTDDKVSIKAFLNRKERQVGKKYFKQKKDMYYLTYNFKTNDLYHGSLINYHLKKKNKKTLRRNQFWKQPIYQMIGQLIGFYNDIRDRANAEIEKVIMIFLSNIPNVEKSPFYGPDEIMFKTRADALGVKLPDNWQMYSRTYPTITKKILKKNNFKYIEAFQDFYGLSGGKFKKILHQIDDLNSNALIFAVEYFGPDFIRNKPTNEIINILDYDKFDYFNELLTKLQLVNFGGDEKDNFWKLLISDVKLSTLRDHIDFIIKLKKFGEDVKLKSKTPTEFNEEHSDFSSLLHTYEKGESFRYYNDEFIERVETPIYDGGNYYPVVLTSSKEYNNESNIQSNCVRNYIDSPSIIISIRKGDKDSEIRATIEYRIRGLNKGYDIHNVQCLGRFNQKLDLGWNNVVKILDDRIKMLGKSNIFTLPEMITEFKTKKWYKKLINTKQGYPMWDNETEEVVDL